MAHGHTPARDGALGIVLFNLHKLLFCFLVPEGMQHGHTALDRTLHRCCAGSWEMHGADLGFCRFLVMMAFIRDRKQTKRNSEYGQAKDSFHGSTAGRKVYRVSVGRSKGNAERFATAV